MVFIKQDDNGNKGKQPRKKAAEQTSKSEQLVRVVLNDDPNEIVKTADSVAYDGLSEIAEQLGRIQNSLKSYNVNACDGEMTFNVGLHTGQNSYPVRLVLEGDAVDSIADSLKRIADALTKD